jgi:hypothetical protein
MQLSAQQRGALLAAAAALLAVGLAPWPELRRGGNWQHGSSGGGKCPAGFSSGGGAGSLPPGHPPVREAPPLDFSAPFDTAPAPTALYFDDPVPLPPLTGAVARPVAVAPRGGLRPHGVARTRPAQTRSAR